MKKLINDPSDVVAEALRGMAAAHPGTLRVDHREPDRLPRRRARRRQGRPGLRRRVRARAAARRLRRPRHARRRLRRRGLHLPGSRPDAGGHHDRRRRRRRPAHRQELHRRRHELRDGRRARRRRDRRRRRHGRHRRRRRRPGQPVHGGPARGRRHGARGEDRRGRGRAGPQPRRGRRGGATGSNAGGRSMGIALTSCTVPAAGQPTFDLPETEMEIGIGIHGEPGRRRVPLAPARQIAEMLLEPILADLDFTARRRRARVRQRHGWHAAARAVPDVRRGRGAPGEGRGDRRCARWSGRTSPAWTWPAARSHCSGSTTTCCGCGTRRCPRRRCGGGVVVGELMPETVDVAGAGPVDAAVRRRGRSEQGAAHPARRGDRRRRPRRQHGPRAWPPWSRRSRRTRPRSRRRCSSRSGMTLVRHGRRGERAALRHVLPADGARSRATGPLDARRLRHGAARRAGRRRVAAARPRRATRRCSTRSPRPSTPSSRRWPGVATLRSGAGRGGRRAAEAGRDATVPHARSQGPGELPGRAQRRAPGPRRDVRGPAGRHGEARPC